MQIGTELSRETRLKVMLIEDFKRLMPRDSPKFLWARGTEPEAPLAASGSGALPEDICY